MFTCLKSRLPLAGFESLSTMVCCIIYSVSIILFLTQGGFCAVVTGPSHATVVLDRMHELECVVAAGDFPTWEEFFPNGTTERLYTVTSRFSQDSKYSNFYISGTLPVYNLMVEDVQIEDEGVYQCATTDTDISGARLSVEVPTNQMSISCKSCDGDDSEPTCQCTCFAEGGYPQSLNITWDVDPGRTASIQQESEKKNGKYDFTSTASVTVTANKTVVRCSVKGYVNQADIEKDFSDRVILEQTLTSPTDCGLTLKEAEKSPDGDCNVQLNCSCQGVPPINTCTFYNGTQGNDIPDKSSCSINHPVPLGTEATFLCSGSNGINFDQDTSDPVPFKCLKATTPRPTKTVVTTRTPDSAPVGLIVSMSIIGVILIVCVSGGAVYCICYKKRGKGQGGSNDSADGNGVNKKLADEQPEYAAVNKPKSEPKPAPRSSQPPDNKEQVELQYADLDHGNRGASKEIRKPADEPTEYATVQSVIV